MKRLGSGGMGDVYLAEHKDLQTPVAVKLLNRDISDNHETVQRFFNEARIVSKIKHAGTVKIFDSGFYDSQAYLIMELLDGESLADRISNGGAMPVGVIVDVARQIASVLEATHRQGVIHRDLKPDNIFLVLDDERASGERVKVLDFGIAKLSGTLAIVSPKTSGTMGTPAYMAPEQWGDSANVDWRADAYSLGCVMFEMACGRPPFLAQSIAEAFTKHCHTAAPAPSSLVPGLPAELEQLILRLLAKEPAERAVSMGQVTRELAELMGAPLSNEQRRAPTDPADPADPVAPAPSLLPVQNTTLGASAAELQDARPRRSSALVGAVITVAAAMIAFVVVMAVRKGDTASGGDATRPVSGGPAASASPEPAAASTPTAPVPAPAPVVPPAPVAETPPATKPPTIPSPVVEPPPISVATPGGTPPPASITKPKPRPKPTTTPAPPKPAVGSGSAKPPAPKPDPDDNGFGGRI